MPTVDQTIVALANASPSLIAILVTPYSSPARTMPGQFKPDTIGTAARPAIAYQRISNPRETDLKSGKAGLGRVRMQFTIFAQSAAIRAQLKAALRTTFAGYTDRNAGGVIDRIVYDTERDQHDGVTNDFMSFVDYMIWHIED